MNRSDLHSTLYRLILRMHPQPFLDRFGDEMLWIFEEERKAGSGMKLLLDGALSLLRQRIQGAQYSRPVVSSFGLLESGLSIPPWRFLEGAASSTFLLACIILQLGKTGAPLMGPLGSPATPPASAGLARTVAPAGTLHRSASAPASAMPAGSSMFAGAVSLPLQNAPASMQAAGQDNQRQGFDPIGIWQGTLPGTRDLRVVLKIAKADDGRLKALFYNNIDQSGQALPTTAFSHQGSSLEFALGSINATFKGKAGNEGNSILGRWTQNGESKPLSLQRATERMAWTIPPPPSRLEAKSKDVQGTYEVATVKPAEPWAQGSGMRVRGRELEAVNVSLSDLIQFGYELQAKQIQSGPDWTEKDKFDIVMLFEGENYPNDPQCKSMVRQVLAERFGLKAHEGRAELPVYALVLSKAGPKLTKSEGDPNGLPGLHLSAPGVLNVRNATMTDLAGALQRNVLNRPVTDRTGLAGRWDFGLEWTPDENPSSGRAGDQPFHSDKPDLNTAMQQQLGLQLDSTKASVISLVIDHVEKPSQN